MTFFTFDWCHYVDDSHFCVNLHNDQNNRILHVKFRITYVVDFLIEIWDNRLNCYLYSNHGELPLIQINFALRNLSRISSQSQLNSLHNNTKMVTLLRLSSKKVISSISESIIVNYNLLTISLTQFQVFLKCTTECRFTGPQNAECRSTILMIIRSWATFNEI